MKITKKMLSVIMTVAMVVTMLPFSAITANSLTPKEEFESRVAEMASSGYSKMYTNISPAYKAYKDLIANKAGAEAALSAALTNMQPFVEATGTANPSGENFTVTNTANETYYRNVVYSEPANGAHAFGDYAHREMKERYAAAWVYGTHAYIYYPQAVLLYDGKNTPILPVVVGFNNWDNLYSLNMLTVHEQMADFDLSLSWWHGYNDEKTTMWPTANDALVPVDPNNTSENKYAETPNNKNDGKYRIYKNGLEFTASPTSAYICYSSSTWGMVGQYTYLGGDHQINGYITNAVPDVDIINYKKLIDALKSASNDSKNKTELGKLTTDYSLGGLENMFNAFDSATSINPMTGSTFFNHTYDYSASGVEEAMDKAALLCGNDIDASVVLLSDIKITTETANYNRLCDAIEAYEAKMLSMDKLHTNLEAAYKAYLLACQYKDAFEYGAREDFENPTLAGAAEALENATKKMKDASSRSWDGKAYYGSSGNDAKNGYSNVVYSDSGVNVWHGVFNKAYTDWDLTTSRNNVLIYDGAAANNVYYPIILATKCEDKKYTSLCAATSSTDMFELREVWRGYKSGDDGEGNYYFVNPVDGSGEDGYDNNEDWSTGKPVYSNSEHTLGYQGNYTTVVNGVNENKNTWRYWYNRLYYKGSGDTTNYYEKQTSTPFTVYGSFWKGALGIYNRTDQSESKTFSTDSYVINYKPLRDKIINTQFSSIDVKNYQEGGLIEYFHKLDEISKIDPNQYSADKHPNGYDYSANTETAVQACANDIKAALNKTAQMPTINDCPVDENTAGDIFDDGELKPISEDNGAYTNLKIALEENKNAPAEQGCIVNATWNDYEAKVLAAQQAMSTIANNTNIDTNTGKDGYAINGGGYTKEEINTLATDLDAAINALYDLANSAHPLKFSYEETEDHTGYFQCYSNNSHIVDAESQETTVSAEMDAYDELGIVYKTLDKTRYKNRELISNGKTSYDDVKTEPGDPGQEAQSIVDDGTAALITAINESNASEAIEDNQYIDYITVNFEVYTVGLNGTVSENAAYTNSANYQYGTTPTYSVTDSSIISAINAVSGFEDVSAESVTVDHWEVAGKRVNLTDKSLKLNYQQSNTTITLKAYVRQPSQAAKLVIKDFFGNDFYTLDVYENTTIVIDSNDINNVVIGGINRRVPNSITYAVGSWAVNYEGETTSLNTTVGELIGDKDVLTLRPNKTSFRPSGEGGAETTYPFTMDGVQVGSYAYDYHLRVNANEDVCTPYGGEVYGIAFYNSDHGIFVPVTYDSTYRFYVNRDMDFYTIMHISKENATEEMPEGYYLPALLDETTNNPRRITGDETLFYLNHKLPMVFSYSEPTAENLNNFPTITSGGQTIICANRWTTRSAFTAGLPEGVKITGAGTLRTTNAMLVSDDSFVIENAEADLNSKDYSKILNKPNSQYDHESNQFSYSLKKTFASNTEVYTRAYVKYTYTYTEKSGKSAKINAVAYGPLCVSYYDAPLS